MADKDKKESSLSLGTVVFIVIAGIIAVALAYLIFSPQPEKDVSLEPGTVVSEGWQVYRSAQYGFDIQYPPAYRVDESFQNGVAFYIPQSMDARTNLSSDSRISVERLATGKSCVATQFVENGVKKDDATIGDRDFLYAEATGAAAGNLYEEYAYALPSGAGCYAVHLFLHSGRIENYDPGAVKQFDREGLIKTARDMAGTLVLRTPSGTKQYSSRDYDLSFSYPDTYTLSERDIDLTHRVHHAITLVDSAYTPPANGEGPTAITVDIFQNDLDHQSARDFITGTSWSNYKLGDGAIASTTYGSLSGLQYGWSGLYQGRSFVVSTPDWIYLFSVTYDSPSDQILKDFNVILATVRIK